MKRGEDLFRLLRTSDVGLKHGGVDVGVEVDGVLEERRHALELGVIPQNLQGRVLERWHRNRSMLRALRILLGVPITPISPLTSSVSSASIRVSEKLLRNEQNASQTVKTEENPNVRLMKHSSPAPGVLSITGEWTQLIIWEGVVKVTVVGVVEHGSDALPER